MILIQLILKIGIYFFKFICAKLELFDSKTQYQI
ncbi:hypothetical protein TTHERM_001522378 (macronuclear) [Tetrahymena thermophila SB210]|uniref:Uncharacterized protein n=1 Tax=Tetrahymena thermophila (strain SB210) TaxID=312017 RepID=W7X9Z2_TETTS|nr:hypothetical protein TTHERM_001522378 [Tetrahymena thermophila SB210]EWS74147.1 hypothetical protein TTHERM_001522378 [Tetrahymena thermophila SB210]|eukprot:XP_012653317.1 hypothetical protein TTHERM_001522378 [Tetrahymena thermophila SB210]